MKTLNEVIKVFETGMLFSDKPYDEAFREFNSDALHYLKEYRSDKLKWEADWKSFHGFYVALKYWAEQQENPPLTWDEVKQMVGKPIWVEYNFRIDDKDFRDKSKRWCIVREFKPWHDTEIIITENGFVLSKNEQIKDWQAYRKEREFE